MRCFKRFSPAKCRDCHKPVPLWHRLKCFINYVTWKTDPLPVEQLLGFVSVAWAIAVASSWKHIQSPHFDKLWTITTPHIWAWAMGVIGALQLVTPMFGMVQWVRWLRFAGAFSSAFVWTTMACITVIHMHLVPFTASCVVYSLAAWWVFLRSAEPPCEGR